MRVGRRVLDIAIASRCGVQRRKHSCFTVEARETSGASVKCAGGASRRRASASGRCCDSVADFMRLRHSSPIRQPNLLEESSASRGAHREHLSRGNLARQRNSRHQRGLECATPNGHEFGGGRFESCSHLVMPFVSQVYEFHEFRGCDGESMCAIDNGRGLPDGGTGVARREV